MTVAWTLPEAGLEELRVRVMPEKQGANLPTRQLHVGRSFGGFTRQALETLYS